MKKRKDCFWGIHCDFHAKPEMGKIGRTLREEDIREICRLLKPDYWQVDCKGHPGWASYPSEIGNAMPEFALDTLALWRKVTREEGVALYVHYSGVIDNKYCEENPDEYVRKPDGTPNIQEPYNATRRGGRYLEEVLIPQLLEVADRYGVDGVWVDGDCWGSIIDYHPDVVAGFEKETGISLNGNLPVKFGDAYFDEYSEYNRELYRRYLRRYVEAIHEKFPDFQITSNWMYSDHAPEEMTVDLDYLSGDLMPWNSFNWARYASRAIAQNDKPWDLMAWTFRGVNRGHLDFLPVHPTQLIQQAAAVISMGGGFQEVVGQLTDGSPNMALLRQLKPLSEFMQSRKAYCFRGRPIHQAAMLLSSFDRKKESRELYTRGKTQDKLGLTALLCDIGQSLEIVSEHNLKGRTAEYPLLIVPELIVGLAEETIRELLDYAYNGGNLLLTGSNTAKVFAENGAPYQVKKVEDDILSVPLVCQSNSAEDQRYFTLNDRQYGGVFFPVEIQAENVEVIANTCYTFTGKRHPFAVIIPYGKGKIAVVGADIGAQYLHESQYVQRDLMRVLTKRLYTPKVIVESVVGMLEIVCLEKDGRLMIQLINGNGNHASESCATEDVIPPVVDAVVSVALDAAPQAVKLQPGDIEVPFIYENGRAAISVGRVDMHNVVEIIP